MYKQGLQLLYRNTEDVLCTTNIYNTLSGAGDAVFTPLTGADDALHFFTLDNDESKFSPIKAKQAEIRFVSTSAINLTTFIGSSDNQWYVESFTGDVLQFRGFLVLDDMDEDFLDSEFSNIVTLIATDNIGLLKDIPLGKPDGTNPRGFFSIIQYIAWCLQKTGIAANINVVHNLREEHTPSETMYQSCFLWAKTFEKDINESLSCYEVLEMILAQDAYLTQENGEWWIIRIDDLQDNDIPCFVFDSNGSFLTETDYDPVQVFGLDESLKFAEMGTFVKAQDAVKSTALTYNYEFPKEIIDNIDFSRGDFLSVVNPYNPMQDYSNVTEFPTVGAGYTFYRATDTNTVYKWIDSKYWPVVAAAYRIADWLTVGGPFGYIRRIFRDGTEIERYVVIPAATGSQDHYIQSNPVYVHLFDKLTISVDWRIITNLTGGGTANVFVAQVRLYGDNGTYWTLTNRAMGDEISGQWIQSNSSFSIIRYLQFVWNRNSLDERDFQTVSVQSAPLPVSGKVVLLIREVTTNDGRHETHVANLRFTYQPYINGSYQKYIAQRYTISQAINTKKAVDETVSISNSPKRLFKGAIHIRRGIDFVLAGRFYDGRQFGATVPAEEYLHPFGHNQAYCVWNQNNRPFRLFDFTAQGLNGSDLLPGITHRFQIADPSPHTEGKWFMMLHLDQDLKLCSWKGVMCEFFDEQRPKDYDSPIALKYISEQ